MTPSPHSMIAVAVLAAAACKASSNQPAPGSAMASATGSAAGQTAGQTAGSSTGSSAGSAPAPAPARAPGAIRWTGTDGELVLALTPDGALEGPCGVTGKVTRSEVEIGGEAMTWTDVTRTDRRYSIAKLPWTIELATTGEATLIQKDGTKVPLGKVTGTETEAALGWFGALIVAAPSIKIKLSLASLDDKLVLDLEGPADLQSWAIRSGGQEVAKKQRGAPVAFAGTPATNLDPAKLVVTGTAPHSFGNRWMKHQGASVVRGFVSIEGSKPRAYLRDRYVITEASDGALSWATEDVSLPTPLARLRGRKSCRAHDIAVLALVQTFLTSQDGWKMTRVAESKWR